MNKFNQVEATIKNAELTFNKEQEPMILLTLVNVMDVELNKQVSMNDQIFMRIDLFERIFKFKWNDRLTYLLRKQTIAYKRSFVPAGTEYQNYPGAEDLMPAFDEDRFIHVVELIDVSFDILDRVAAICAAYQRVDPSVSYRDVARITAQEGGSESDDDPEEVIEPNAKATKAAAKAAVTAS